MKLYILRIGAFLLLFPVMLVLSELSVRYFHLKEIGEPRHDAEEAPYMPLRLKANYQGALLDLQFSTNQYGFRDEDDFPRTAPAGEYRILALGDSVGFGIGVPAADHYTQVLEQELNAGFPSRQFRVVNAAGQGYSPSTYYAYLKHEGIQLGPRLVIAEIELCNDITDEALLRWEAGEGQATFPQTVRGGRYVIAWDGNLLGVTSIGPYFFEKTYLYTLLSRRVLNALNRIDPTEPNHGHPGTTYYIRDFERYLLDDERLESGWSRTFRALEATRDLLDSRGISFLVMILPSRYIFEEHAPRHQAFARKLVKRAVALARKKQIPYLDFTGAMESNGGSDLYFDFAHPTAEGNRVIGKWLAEYFISAADPSVSLSRASGARYLDPEG
ncbi:MAG: SGNH/GDSL hydrolase family protein [Acidobacteriota bacterium]